MTKLGRILLVCSALASLALGARAVSAREWQVLPLLVRLEGIGPVYGLAAGVRELSDDRLHLYVARTGGEVEAQGALLADLPLGAPWAGLHLFAAQVERASLQTSYTRGTEKDRPVRQELSGGGAGGVLELSAESLGLLFTAGLAQSTVVLEDFRTEGGRRISLPNANLHDIETTHLLLTLLWSDTDPAERPTRGAVLGAGLAAQTGRAGQSDTLVQTLHGTGYLPLTGRITWALHARAEDAQPLNARAEYDSDEEVAAELGITCDALADPRDRAECEALAADLARFIAASNRFGTATPLGGSTSLRAYREFRFRAAHTRLLSSELRWRIGGRAELALFMDRGYAADQPDDLYRKARDSAGVGLRFWIGGLPLRLEAADGSEGRAWFFTVGLPW